MVAWLHKSRTSGVFRAGFQILKHPSDWELSRTSLIWPNLRCISYTWIESVWIRMQCAWHKDETKDYSQVSNRTWLAIFSKMFPFIKHLLDVSMVWGILNNKHTASVFLENTWRVMRERETELRTELNIKTQSRLVTGTGCLDFWNLLFVSSSRGVQVWMIKSKSFCGAWWLHFVLFLASNSVSFIHVKIYLPLWRITYFPSLALSPFGPAWMGKILNPSVPAYLVRSEPWL